MYLAQVHPEEVGDLFVGLDVHIVWSLCRPFKGVGDVLGELVPL